MVFASVIFLFVFLPALLIVYFCPLAKGRTVRNTLLLLASLVFYAWGETLFVFIMLASILINWALTIAMVRFSHKKAFLTTAVVWNVALLFAFKYLAFAARNIAALFPSLGIPHFDIALPIGISFFTFQAMSYVFDVYYEKTPVQKNFFRLALYISFFPQLVAGPIVRYSSIEAQIDNRHESLQLVSQGIIRFIIGLFKKTILADMTALIVDKVFGAELATLPASAAWIGCLAYCFQIYFDFSGYSDMAIGLGKIFGFSFDENFNYPYIASSITDFWRRWHISLSTWFRDYVYIPLGGNRCSPARNTLNLFCVWLLTGIWHGAAWTFWLWGLYYFVLLMLERTFVLKRLTGIASKTLWRLMTLVFIALGWVLFRSENVSSALTFAGRMFGLGGLPAVPLSFEPAVTLLFALCAAASLPIFPALERHYGQKPTWQLVRTVFLTAAFFLSVCTVIGGAYSPFIYFNF